MAQFAVIGLGSFGATVAQELTKLNHDVIGIDTVKKNVENLANVLTHAVIADATDEHVLDELNIQNCDAVVVAIGEDIEAAAIASSVIPGRARWRGPGIHPSTQSEAKWIPGSR